MGKCPQCGQDADELVVSDTEIVSGIVYECPSCEAILGTSDATDI
jgi:hypothetical protein